MLPIIRLQNSEFHLLFSSLICWWLLSSYLFLKWSHNDQPWQKHGMNDPASVNMSHMFHPINSECISPATNLYSFQSYPTRNVCFASSPRPTIQRTTLMYNMWFHVYVVAAATHQ